MIKGSNRHILTDTAGNLVHALISAADVQYSDGEPPMPAEIIYRFPWLRHLFANGGVAGGTGPKALRRSGRYTVEIINWSNTASGFEVRSLG